MRHRAFTPRLTLLGKALIRGELSTDAYLAAIGHDQRWEGDVRLLVDVLAQDWPELTERQLELLADTGAGLDLETVARRNGLRPHTVARAVASARLKLRQRGAPLG